jgi:hypothetical protein
METLREKLNQPNRFLLGAELVSTRGGLGEKSGAKARAIAADLCGFPAMDWISVRNSRPWPSASRSARPARRS